MKILCLNYEFPPIGGGGSTVSFEIAKGYAMNGHDVDVVTMRYKDLPVYEEKNGIHIHRVRCLRSKKEICHPWEQLTYLVSARSFIKKLLKEKSYDVCHAHFIIPTGPLALWVKRKYGIPYMVTAHGSDVLGYNKRFAFLYPLLKRPWNRIVKNAAAVTAPSVFLSDKIREIAKNGKIMTISNGLDLSKFRPMKKEKRILVVARLFVNKGIQDFIDALKNVDLGDWMVDIVGEGPYRGSLEKRSAQSNLGNKVRFRGWIDNNSSEMKKLYGKASIFISASYFESFGQSVIEAISAGCYPLLSDIGGHRSIVNNDAFYFTPGNPAELRDKLQRLVRHGTGEFSIDIRRFSWENVIKAYEDAINETVNGTAGHD